MGMLRALDKVSKNFGKNLSRRLGTDSVDLLSTGKSILHSNDPINAIGALGKDASYAFTQSSKKFGGLKGILTADRASWGEGKMKALGLQYDKGAKGFHANDLSAKQVAKSMFLNSDGSISKSNVAAAYIGGNMALRGNMGIPMVSSSGNSSASDDAFTNAMLMSTTMIAPMMMMK